MTLKTHFDGITTSPAAQIISLAAKSQIAEPGWQLLLRSAKESGIRFRCSCGLFVEPFFDPRVRKYNVRALFKQLELHDAPGCGVVHGPPAFPSLRNAEVVYTDAIFFAHGERLALGGCAEPSRLGSERYYGDFTHLAQRAFIDGTLLAIAECNSRRGASAPLVSPGHQLQSKFIAECLHDGVMSDGASPLQAAARNGLALYWGVANERLVTRLHASRYHQHDETLLMSDCWSEAGQLPVLPRFRIPHAVGLAAGGKVWEYSRLIEPPYLVFIAAGLETHVVQRLTIVPLAAHGFGGTWHSKESGAEGELIQRIQSMRQPVVMIKPAVSADLRLLGSVWRHPIDDSGFLPCRPDLLVLCPRGLVVYQLEGSRDPLYRAGVRDAITTLQKFFGSDPVVVRAIGLTELRSGLPRFEREIAALA